MALKWEASGDGSYVASDEAGRMLAKITEMNLDPERCFCWYIELPDFPEDDVYADFNENFELIFGTAPDGWADTLEEAMASVEKAMPSPESLAQLKAETDMAREEKAWRDAAPNN